jgi:hypothetical protein
MTNDEDNYLSNLICIRLVLFGALNPSQNGASDTSPNVTIRQFACTAISQSTFAKKQSTSLAEM